jgi:hypothetical protein
VDDAADAVSFTGEKLNLPCMNSLKMENGQLRARLSLANNVAELNKRQIKELEKQRVMLSKCLVNNEQQVHDLTSTIASYCFI